MHFMKLCSWLYLLQSCELVTGEQYNLIGSSTFAVLGENFTWTCRRVLHMGEVSDAVAFYRNAETIVGMSYSDEDCIYSGSPKYIYTCSSSTYTLMIPAKNMTENEQYSQWWCGNFKNFTIRSPNVTLKIAIDVHNVTLSSSNETLTIKEGSSKMVQCIVNKNAIPLPNIELYLESKIIHSMVGTETNFTLSGRKENNKKTLECRASNNGKKPKVSSTILDVEYPPSVHTLTQQNIIEGRDLTVTCEVSSGNPPSTTIFWTKEDNTLIPPKKAILQFYNIQRNTSGTYICTAKNSYSDGSTGEDSQLMIVNVLYPPSVSVLSQKDIIEGKDLTVTCLASKGNPNSTTIYWTKEDTPGFRQNGSTLLIPSINRTSSGTYRCTAENNYNNGEKGRHSQSVVVNVQYQPTICNEALLSINESEQVTLTRNISSNPLSNVSWYDRTKLLKNQTSVPIATFTIKKATCTDTKNYTILASNGIGNMVTAFVELIVNCKPRANINNITLGVTDIIGIEFSTVVIAFPKPQYKLEHVNGTVNNQMMDTLIRNALNNFTIHFNQTDVNQSDYGTYHLNVSNLFGATIITVNVLPQRKPDNPRSIEVTCEVTRAIVKWISSFNGGDSQNFTVFTMNSQHEAIQSAPLSDAGENEIHVNYIQNLQPSVKYSFFVSAQNKHGNSSSDQKVCTTSNKESSLSAILGGAAAGGIALSIIGIVVVILLRKHMIDKGAGKTKRLKLDADDTEDDGLKENVLYVSADTKVDEKPEDAVYAAVNKNVPGSNNNANVYAEVKKSGQIVGEKNALYTDVKPKKGLFKKDQKDKKDGNIKKKKGKRQIPKQDVAEVYENPEEIAMEFDINNVYSNTGQKDKNNQEGGYKNKDGLLYVEVQFDAKTAKGNPVIHGEDEKTDYATVEFPMPASSHE